jgi:pyruvate dehydrogenase E2 component (dihydrolipoamide acetyltransferase)
VTRALALTFAKHPGLNCKVGWAQLMQRPSVDIFCQVTTDSGRDLSGFKLPDVDRLGLREIGAKLTRSASDIREDKDPAFKRSRDLFNMLPLWALRIVLLFMDFLTNRLNLHLPSLGMPRDPFGSAMVTSVGMLGVDSGFAPFTPIARCPIILTVTRIKQRPWVVDGQVVARPVLRLCGTFDHRVIDGYHAGEVCTEVERFFAEPELLLTDDERASWT